MEQWKIGKVQSYFPTGQLFFHPPSINLKHYSKTCSHSHLCKTTDAESAQANSRQIVSDSQMKKKKICLQQQLQNFIQQRNAKKHKEQLIKNKRLSDYTYSIANL